MKLTRFSKPKKNDVRTVISDQRAIKRAAKESIQDQKVVAKKATELRARLAR